MTTTDSLPTREGWGDWQVLEEDCWHNYLRAGLYGVVGGGENWMVCHAEDGQIAEDHCYEDAEQAMEAAELRHTDATRADPKPGARLTLRLPLYRGREQFAAPGDLFFLESIRRFPSGNVIYSGRVNGMAATVHADDVERSEEAEAKARVEAAAPDMLAALELARETIRTWASKEPKEIDRALATIRAAIEKARRQA